MIHWKPVDWKIFALRELRRKKARSSTLGVVARVLGSVAAATGARGGGNEAPIGSTAERGLYIRIAVLRDGGRVDEAHGSGSQINQRSGGIDSMCSFSDADVTTKRYYCGEERAGSALEGVFVNAGTGLRY